MAAAEVERAGPAPSDHTGRGLGFGRTQGKWEKILWGSVCPLKAQSLRIWGASGGKRGFLAPNPTLEVSGDYLSPLKVQRRKLRPDRG